MRASPNSRSEYAYMFMISRARSADGDGQRVRIVSSANWVGEHLDWIIKRWAPWLDAGHSNPAKPGELRWYYRLKGDDNEREAPDATPIWDEPANDWVIPRSRTFIPAGLNDNPYLGDDYKASLQLLPEPLRSPKIPPARKLICCGLVYPIGLQPLHNVIMTGHSDKSLLAPSDCLGNRRAADLRYRPIHNTCKFIHNR